MRVTCDCEIMYRSNNECGCSTVIADVHLFLVNFDDLENTRNIHLYITHFHVTYLHIILFYYRTIKILS